MEGRACLVWLLGEFGISLPESPYILEQYINSVGNETDPSFKLNLLSASMKLFLRGACSRDAALSREADRVQRGGGDGHGRA